MRGVLPPYKITIHSASQQHNNQLIGINQHGMQEGSMLGWYKGIKVKDRKEGRKEENKTENNKIR